ncbi:BZ3500_MvSof-1268-A1-R1_Chr10-2g02905 [Microbotryum saponariae]|uniref:BZ3500_MvSof-1268-A1-R1_Chr10-2g02905 protein n=1 Tax=Microbotryum saponariae TaxID=289078 RepID=A0A2X0M2C9_9BASI|nr:BZ3501_MvSof-1269-A2-R1_Chr10-2g02491 [Microbotryum saponariae]SDA01713.1 BZ3500_MvSof-1268-A1-R1_Chr10-2g02905 [Microbotryum saponariae]
MTAKHGHDCPGYALEVVPDALLSRETNLSSALISLLTLYTVTVLHSVAIIDGSTTFQHQCKAATDRAKHNEPKRGRLFLNAIIRHLEEIIAATARRIQVVVVFDHPILRSELKRNTVLDRQDRQQPQQPSDKSTPVTHPVPFITNDTLAACLHGQLSKEWEVAFCNGDEPTRVATFVRWSEQGLLVVAAHEADPLVSPITLYAGSQRLIETRLTRWLGLKSRASRALVSLPSSSIFHPRSCALSASTKFGQICDVALEPNRVVLVSADSDFFMLLGADQARYRAVRSGKDRNISLVDLAVLDAHPAVWNSCQRFVASLILGCDYFRGITGIGPTGVRDLPGQWLEAAMNVDSEPAPTEKRIEDFKSLCAKIDPIQNLLRHYKDETFAKATKASITAISQGCRVRFEGTPHGDPSKVSRYAYAPIRRNPFSSTNPVPSTGPLPPLSGLLTIQDPKLQRDHATARRRQAEQPARMGSTHRLAVQGTVRASDYRLVEPEFGDSAEQRNCKSNNSKSIERNKATTAAEVRALFSKHSDSCSSGGGGGGGKSPGGVIYRMSAMTGTLDDLVREPMAPGGLRQGAHRVRRPPARTACQAEASAPPAATRNRASSLELIMDVDSDSALVVDESDSRSYSITAMEIDR